MADKVVKNETVEAYGDCRIDWMYPEIYGKTKPQNTLTIDLTHIRAADGIRIKYDSERDGWIIEQASIFEWNEEDEVCDSDWQEVAFVQAWGREGKARKEMARSQHHAHP